MPTRTTPHDAILRKAQEQFSASVLAILKARGMKRSDLARKSEASSGPVKKTIYNTINKDHPPKLETWSEVARLLDVPLWVLLIEDGHKDPDLLDTAGTKRLVALVQNYLATPPDKRSDIEKVAESEAIKGRLSKK